MKKSSILLMTCVLFGGNYIHQAHAITSTNFADINRIDRQKKTALHRAIESQTNKNVTDGDSNQDYTIAYSIANSDAINVNLKDSTGNTAFHTFLETLTNVDYDNQNDCDKLFDVLLEKTDLRLKDSQNKTPLHLFCERLQNIGAAIGDNEYFTEQGSTKINRTRTKAFIDKIGTYSSREQTAILNGKDRNGNTPLHYAARYGDNIKLMEQFDDNGSIMELERTHAYLVKLLIDEGADVNIRGPLNRTPLHIACIGMENTINNITYTTGQFETVKLLVEAGATINITDTYNATPLHYAAESHIAINTSDPYIVEYLTTTTATP